MMAVCLAVGYRGNPYNLCLSFSFIPSFTTSSSPFAWHQVLLSYDILMSFLPTSRCLCRLLYEGVLGSLYRLACTPAEDPPVSCSETHLCLRWRPTCVSDEDPPVSLKVSHLCLQGGGFSLSKWNLETWFENRAQKAHTFKKSKYNVEKGCISYLFCIFTRSNVARCAAITI